MVSTLEDLLWHLPVPIPMHWVKDVQLAKTNAALKTIKHMLIELGELGCYIGLWLLMTRSEKWLLKDSFWMQYDELMNPCPYNFKKYMNQT